MDSMPLLATGTDGIIAENAVVPGAVTGRAEPHLSASSGTLRIVGGSEDQSSEVLNQQGFGVDLHSSAAGSLLKSALTRTTGVEPATSAVTGRCSNQLNYSPLTWRGYKNLRNHAGLKQGGLLLFRSLLDREGQT
jgi:hypothetical protein